MNFPEGFEPFLAVHRGNPMRADRRKDVVRLHNKNGRLEFKWDFKAQDMASKAKFNGITLPQKQSEEAVIYAIAALGGGAYNVQDGSLREYLERGANIIQSL